MLGQPWAPDGAVAGYGISHLPGHPDGPPVLVQSASQEQGPHPWVGGSLGAASSGSGKELLDPRLFPGAGSCPCFLHVAHDTLTARIWLLATWPPPPGARERVPSLPQGGEQMWGGLEVLCGECPHLAAGAIRAISASVSPQPLPDGQPCMGTCGRAKGCPWETRLCPRGCPEKCH